jgi:hypothetical protein
MKRSKELEISPYGSFKLGNDCAGVYRGST